jgi:hypothetical protein
MAVNAKTSKPGTKRRFRTGVNLEGTLRDHILTPVRGQNGAYIALREAINNSLDAKSTKVRIKFGTYENQPAIIIMDDGVGMNHAGITSAMSYAFSSRMREDLTTIGANGTGLKSLLGLGSLEKTKITAITVHGKNDPVKMEITFKYVVALAQKKVNGDDHIAAIPLPKDWASDIEGRTTGTTIILTGFDGRKIKSPDQVISQFGDFLTPKACRFVEVQNGKLWFQVEPETFKGEPYEIALQNDNLGEVIFDLYYGSYGDGPKVCGPVNEIIPLTRLYQNMDRAQKGKVSKIWKTVSGHIYIQTANKYRMHEGSFSEEFYSSNACNELIDMLKEVSEELEDLSRDARNKQLLKKRDVLIDKIIKASNSISPVDMQISPADAGNRAAGVKPSTREEDVYIVPKGLRLYPEEKVPIVLRNQGKNEISFAKATWHVDGKIIALEKSLAGTATVKALKQGSTEIVVRGDFGKHTIQILVSHAPSAPFVSGPNYIKPGNDYTYELKRHEKDNVVWEIQQHDKSVTIKESPASKKEVIVHVPGHCPDGAFILTVRNRSTKAVVAEKRINIAENGSLEFTPIIHIGKKDYILKKEFYFPETIAQVDYAFNDSAIPEIVVNTLHPRIKDLGAYYAADPILVSIANAAMIDQVSEGIVKREDAARLAEEFVSSVKDKIKEDLERDKK